MPQTEILSTPLIRARTWVIPQNPDGTELYLQEIAPTKLLDGQKERALGRRVEEGLMVKSIKTSLIENGDRAQAEDVALQFRSYLQGSYHETLQEVLWKNRFYYFDKAIDLGFYQAVIDQVAQQGKSDDVKETGRALRNISIAEHILEGWPPGRKWRKEGEKEYLAGIVTSGEIAREQFIEANLKLAVNLAKKHRHKGLDLDDLIQEGNLGLIRAVDKYDYRKGFKFSTYATNWIIQFISRGLIDKSRAVRLPAHMAAMANQIWPVRDSLWQEKGEEPTVEEIAFAANLPITQVALIIRASMPIASLGFPTGEDSSLEALIADPNALDPQEAAEQALLKQELEGAMVCLSVRDRGIMRLRYGLADGRPRTLEETGKKFHLSRERIRQIERNSLKAMRNSGTAGHVKVFLSGVDNGKELD